MPYDRLSRPSFVALTAGLIGTPVTRPWRGLGTAVFLELGPLTATPSTRRPGLSLQGLASVMIESSWRVERPRSVAFGSWSGERKMSRGVASLEGARVKALSLEGSLPELRIAFDDGRALQSFTTVEGQPAWALRLADGSWLSVTRGIVVRQRPALHQERPASEAG